MTLCIKGSFDTQHVTLSIAILCNDAKCHYAECRVLFIIMLNVIVLSVVMLSVVAPVRGHD